MADISKCVGINCPVKQKCYRFTANESKWQSWSDFHTKPNNEGCDYFWETEEQIKSDGEVVA